MGFLLFFFLLLSLRNLTCILYLQHTSNRPSHFSSVQKSYAVTLLDGMDVLVLVKEARGSYKLESRIKVKHFIVMLKFITDHINM